MINTRFEEYKMRRHLKRNGRKFVFFVRALDEFQAATLRHEYVGEIKGLYHERNEYINLMTSDGAQLRNKKTPMVLCLWEDYKTTDIKLNSYTKISDRIYKVTGVVNIQNWDLFADISLEELDDGKEF